MVENLKIRTFNSRFWRGRYTPGTIWVREGLSKKEKIKTLKHELQHHKFYTNNAVGKILSRFLRRRFYCGYAVLLGLLWILFPSIYLLACVPLFLIDSHECLTSLQYPGKLSFLLAFSEMIGLYSLFWVRVMLI